MPSVDIPNRIYCTLSTSVCRRKNERYTVLYTCYKVEVKLSLSPTLRPTVSRPVCLGIKRPSGAYDQIFITVRQLRVSRYGALSLTRGRVCCLQLLLVLARAVNFGSEFRGTRDHILPSQIRDFPFCCIIRLAGLRWRYSTPPPHGGLCDWNLVDSKLSLQQAVEAHNDLRRRECHIF
jgi:hypothetical protein